MPNWKKVVVSGSDAALSSLNVTGTITAGTFAGLISQSSQVNHNATTNYVANQHIDHTTVSITAGSGLTGGGDISANRTITVGAGLGMTVNADDIAVNTGSTHFTNGVKAKLNTDQVLSGSVSSPSQGTISVGGFTNIDLGLQSGDSPTFAGVTATNFTGTASRATVGEKVDVISGGSTTGLGVYSGSFSGSFFGVNATSGTVTSVGLSLPNIFTVTNSPVTSTGTLTGTLASQTQNTIFAAPNGSNGAPTFRSLVAADIPSLSYLPSSGGTLTGDVNWGATGRGITWAFNTDGASIRFYNTGDGDTDSRLEFNTTDNNNEYFRWTHTPSGGSLYESMKLVPTSANNATLTVNGTVVATTFTGALNGNANTATSAATWTTARNFTIGSTARSVNGSGAVSWTLADIGAAAASHTHAISEVTGLQTALDGKAATGQTMHIGTTAVAINRASAALSLTGVNIDGNAATVTNGVYTTGTQTITGAKTFSGNLTTVSTLPGYSGTTYFWNGSNVQYYWTRIANISSVGDSHVSILITAKTDVNYMPFAMAILSLSAWNGTTQSVKLDALNSQDLTIRVRIDNSGDVWLRTDAEWSSYKSWRILSLYGSPTIYGSNNSETLTTPANSVELLVGQQIRGNQGSITSATVAQTAANVFGSVSSRGDMYVGNGNVVLHAGNYNTYAAAVVHSHAISDVTGLQTALDGKAASSHTHAISAITGLQTALDGKAATGQTFFIGTTQVAINRASAALALTGVSIDGNAGSVTNGVYTTGDQTIGGSKTFSSALIVNKAAQAAGADSYHMELFAPDSGTSQEVSMRFHQGNRFYHQIRARAGLFRFTQGNSDSLVDVYASTFYGALSGNASTATTAANSTLFASQGEGQFVYGDSGRRRGVKLITDWNQSTHPDVAFLSSENSTTNAPSTDFTYGLQYAFHRDGASYRTQIVTSLYSNPTTIWIRNSRDSDVWTSWYSLVHSGNIASQAVNYANSAGTISSQANSATITATTAATADRIVLRDGNGDTFVRYGFASYFNMSHGVSGATTDTIFYSSTDDYIRKNNATGFRASLNVPTRTGGDASGTWGINITGEATGLNSSNYISRVGSSGDYNTDFNNTPAGSVRHLGDDYQRTNNPGGGWWFVDNYRHSNSSNYWGTQIAWGWEDNANSLAQRNVTGGSWSGWVRYLNSSNYSSYALPLSGGTLTGGVQVNQYFTNPSGGNSGVGGSYYQWGYQESGAWTHPFPDLVLGYHTGMKFGAYTGYGGMRFYADHPFLSPAELFSIGNGDNHVRVANNLYVSTANTTGGGIILADDGDIVDLNDGYCAMRFSYGVRIFSANRGGSAVITLSNGGNVTAADFVLSSDERLKTDLVPLTSALSSIDQVKAYRYTHTKTNRQEVGVLAQEIRKILPEAVTEDDEGMMGVSYDRLVPLLLTAVKELSAKVKHLEETR